MFLTRTMVEQNGESTSRMLLLLWMDKIRSRHFEAMFETSVPHGIYRGITIAGFLRWCRISSIHSMLAVGSLYSYLVVWQCLPLGLISTLGHSTPIWCFGGARCFTLLSGGWLGGDLAVYARPFSTRGANLNANRQSRPQISVLPDFKPWSWKNNPQSVIPFWVEGDSLAGITEVTLTTRVRSCSKLSLDFPFKN